MFKNNCKFTIIFKHKDLNYSRSFLFGFRDGSLDKNPKMNKETKKITVV